AVAHAIIHDPLGRPRAELLPPVTFPDGAEFTQAEVPQVLYHPVQKTFYMVVSTTNRTDNAQLDKDLDLTARLYTAKTLNSPWQYAGRLIRREEKRYPAVLVGFDDNGRGPNLLFTGPY